MACQTVCWVTAWGHAAEVVRRAALDAALAAFGALQLAGHDAG